MKNQNYINGQWVDAHSGKTLGVENPKMKYSKKWTYLSYLQIKLK